MLTLELLMPTTTPTREIRPAKRLDNLRYAIRDLADAASSVAKQGHKVLYLNVGDPNVFDFVTPPHVVEAACRATVAASFVVERRGALAVLPFDCSAAEQRLERLTEEMNLPCAWTNAS